MRQIVWNSLSAALLAYPAAAADPALNTIAPICEPAPADGPGDRKECETELFHVEISMSPEIEWFNDGSSELQKILRDQSSRLPPSAFSDLDLLDRNLAWLPDRPWIHELHGVGRDGSAFCQHSIAIPRNIDIPLPTLEDWGRPVPISQADGQHRDREVIRCFVSQYPQIGTYDFYPKHFTLTDNMARVLAAIVVMIPE